MYKKSVILFIIIFYSVITYSQQNFYKRDIQFISPWWIALSENSDSLIIIDQQGNLLINSKKIYSGTFSGEYNKSFVVLDENKAPLLVANDSMFFIKGQIIEKSTDVELNASTQNNLIFKDTNGNIVARLDQNTGNLLLKGVSCIPEQIFFEADSLGGISDAILFQNKIHVVAMYDPDTVPGYPDNDKGAKFFKQALLSENKEVFSFESNSVGEKGQNTDLFLDASNQLGFLSRTWMGYMYGFNFKYRIWDGNTIILQDTIIQANYGITPRISFSSTGKAHIASYSAAYYFPVYHKKNESSPYEWQSFQLTNFSNVTNDMEVTMKNDIFYISCKHDTFNTSDVPKLRVYQINGNQLSIADFQYNIESNCDIKVAPNNQIWMLYLKNDSLYIEKWGSTIENEFVASDININQKATMFFKSDGTPVIAYQTYNKIVVLERNNLNWKKIYEKNNLLQSKYSNNTRHPSLLVKNNKVFLVFADAKRVYCSQICNY